VVSVVRQRRIPAHFPSVARQEISPQSTPKTYNFKLFQAINYQSEKL
jgi:hypothetical protein